MILRDIGESSLRRSIFNVANNSKGKLVPNWEGPFCITKSLQNDAYLKTWQEGSSLGLGLQLDVILTRSGSLDTGHRVWMTPLPEREDKSG